MVAKRRTVLRCVWLLLFAHTLILVLDSLSKYDFTWSAVLLWLFLQHTTWRGWSWSKAFRLSSDDKWAKEWKAHKSPPAYLSSYVKYIKKGNWKKLERSDELQCHFTAVSNEVYEKCDLNLEKQKHYINKTNSTGWRLYQSPPPRVHLCGVITRGFHD